MPQEEYRGKRTVGNCSPSMALFLDEERSNYMVMFLRFITSAMLFANKDLYSAYIDEGMTIELFCRTAVEPLDVDADNVGFILSRFK